MYNEIYEKSHKYIKVYKLSFINDILFSVMDVNFNYKTSILHLNINISEDIKLIININIIYKYKINYTILKNLNKFNFLKLSIFTF